MMEELGHLTTPQFIYIGLLIIGHLFTMVSVYNKMLRRMMAIEFLLLACCAKLSIDTKTGIET